jgi:aryl-alcohol dehydrogenase-like predicted oxidoreductase
MRILFPPGVSAKARAQGHHGLVARNRLCPPPRVVARNPGRPAIATEPVCIGRSDLVVNPIGVGTWQWGDRRYWGYGIDYDAEDIAAAFDAAIAAGLNFFDTAEIYGRGESERLLGRQLERSGACVAVASKYMPLPNRFSAAAVAGAIDASRRRLEVRTIDLYQVHWPFSLLRKGVLLRELARAVEGGLIRWVGVSNYGAGRLRRAARLLASYGVPLVANQVNYSLLNRAPEINGVIAACRELDITLIAYSPLAQGLLTGKYGPGKRPDGAGKTVSKFRGHDLVRVEPVVRALREIGLQHQKSPAQVALNWLIRQPGVVAIPGVKNAAHARSNAGAYGWSLSDAEAQRLNEVSAPWRKRGLLDRLL